MNLSTRVWRLFLAHGICCVMVFSWLCVSRCIYFCALCGQTVGSHVVGLCLQLFLINKHYSLSPSFDHFNAMFFMKSTTCLTHIVIVIGLYAARWCEALNAQFVNCHMHVCLFALLTVCFWCIITSAIFSPAVYLSHKTDKWNLPSCCLMIVPPRPLQKRLNPYPGWNVWTSLVKLRLLFVV